MSVGVVLEPLGRQEEGQGGDRGGFVALKVGPDRAAALGILRCRGARSTGWWNPQYWNAKSPGMVRGFRLRICDGAGSYERCA